jgi:hypothetical protein
VTFANGDFSGANAGAVTDASKTNLTLDFADPVAVVTPPAILPPPAVTPPPVVALEPAAMPPAIVLVPAEPMVSIVTAFNSAIASTTGSPLQIFESVARITDAFTSINKSSAPVSETTIPGLAVSQRIADQFIEGNNPGVFSLPADSFTHTQADAIITISAMLANGKELPNWIEFDSRSNTFKVTPPQGFKNELQIKVIARDNDGREVSTMFKLNVGRDKVSMHSRSSLSEQILLAAKRSTPWLDLVRAQGSNGSTDQSLANRVHVPTVQVPI